MKSLSIACQTPDGPHRMQVWSYGQQEWSKQPVVLCVHGLTRSARDFQPLAEALSQQGYWVLCPDVAGRGGSDWLSNPAHYHVGQYAQDMRALFDQLALGARPVHWVGTSMGGLIGMLVAAQPGIRLASLVLNDVGARVAGQALQRIGDYLRLSTRLRDWDHALQQVKLRFAAFGPHSPEQWRFLTEAVVVPAERGLRFHHDPRIAEVFQAAIAAQPEGVADMDLWPAYEQIQCPCLLIRGESSDLLSLETALEMTKRGPRARLENLPGIGHAPSLILPDQIALIQGFLQEQSLNH